MEEEKDLVKQLRAWLQKLIPNDWDKYDIVAHTDSTLSLSENKSKIRDDIKIWMKDNLKEQAEQAKAKLEEAKR